MALNCEATLLSALWSRDHCIGTGLSRAEPVGITERVVTRGGGDLHSVVLGGAAGGKPRTRTEDRNYPCPT